MAISTLQQAALGSSGDFQAQVAAVVLKESLYKNETMTGLTQSDRDVLARVIQNPNGYGFTRTIIADVNWAVTYDTWASDPEAQNSRISEGVNQFYGLLTGFNPAPPPGP